MAAAAYRAGYSYLGFSSHAPLSFETAWNLSWSDMRLYATMVRRLEKEWEPKGLRILLGLEIDHIEGVASPLDPAYAPIHPDFKIGSVHYITKLFGEKFTVDEPADEFTRHLKSAMLDTPDAVWQEYYTAMRQMICRGGFDIIGHFDLVKKNNEHGRWFDETSTRYLDAAFAAVDEAGARSCVAEVNTGGMARGKIATTYPSLTILKRMRESGVRLTVGDDAHAAAHLGSYQAAAVEAAKAAGYSSLWYLDGPGSWKEIGIGEAGVSVR
jgi:histidinol-phosphatase (PHP family)